MGLESDARAGGLRVSASDIVARPADLTTNVDRLAKAYRMGEISGQEIHDRYGARGIAEDRAATAEAALRTREATEVGPLAIEAKKAMLTPEIVGMQQQATLGSLEEQIANQSVQRETRKQRDQILKAQVAQSLNEIQGNLPAATVRQLAAQYPQLVKPQFNELGLVTNTDEVKKQIAQVKTFQNWVDSMQDMAKQIRYVSTEEVLPNGQTQKVERAYFGQTPAPPQLLQSIAAAQMYVPGTVPDPNVAQKLQQTFGQPGQITPAAPTATAVPVDRSAPAPVPAAPGVPAAPPAQLPRFQVSGPGIPEVGAAAPSGGIVTSRTQSAEAKPTEVESRAFKFAERMDLSEGQYQKALAKGIDPTSAAMQTQLAILEQIPAIKSSKIPVIGPVAGVQLEKRVSPEAKELSSAMGSWSSAILREESGAAIKDEERAQYIRAFFPVTGDPPEVRQAKSEQRRSASAALRAVAERRISPAQYEDTISQLTGLAFPETTSVHTEGSPEAKAWARSGGAGYVTSPAAPDKIETLAPGQPPPADPSVQIIRGPDGRPYRRRQAGTQPTK